MRVAVVLLGAVGCYNPNPPAGVPCGDNDTCPSGQLCVAGLCAGSGGDAAVPDATLTDAPAGCEMWQAKHFDACALPAPLGDLHLTLAQSNFNWDTGNGVLKGKGGVVIPVATKIVTQTNGPEVLIASVNDLIIDKGANLTIAGTRPLLFAVWGQATIAGNLDGAARLSVPGPGGASAPTAACPAAATGNVGGDGTPASGGGGGGYQGTGGHGGNAGGGSAGTPLAPTLVIHGGCSAGSGGAGTGASGARGAGGGAIQITARMSITVTADSTFNVGGGGGTGGHTAYGGGGGGGAGGYLGFDAPAVSLDGVLAANGGAGGGGASDVGDGSSGGNARADNNAATGGAGATATNIGTCTRGGNGSAGGTLNGAIGGTSPCGGGGGGGAAGYILVWSPQLSVTGTLSPPVSGGP